MTETDITGRITLAKPTHRAWLKYLVVLSLLGILVYLAIGAVVAFKVTEPHRQIEPPMTASGVESPMIRSRDGLNLAAWFLPTTSDRALILVHGLNQCRSCEFYGHFVDFAQALRGRGFNVLMIDLRGHGESEGAHVTMGQQEKWDVLGAADWLHARGFQKIGALGVSLGAASVVAAAVEPRGGDRLRAVVLDSCFNTLTDLLGKNFTQETGYPTLILPGGYLMARVLLNVDFPDVQPARDLPKIGAPVFLIYGGHDRYLSPGMRAQMTSARPGTPVWTAEDADHAQIYTLHPQEYVTRVADFFEQSLY
jgi:pimeloyl-ACP methyl ester carboxylesterase